VEKIIIAKNVSIAYGQNEVLKNVSFDIKQGDFIGIAGPNGGGKTTLIKAMLGLVSINEGDFILFNQSIKKFKNWAQIGYLPQKSSMINILFPASVFEIVGLGLLGYKKIPKKINKNDQEKINQILKHLGILHLSKKMFSELSGGQQQKVLLARALVSDPEILIFDEPSTALDPDSREAFFNLIQKLNKEKNITILLITHDTGYIGNYANKLMYLDYQLKYFGEISGFCSSAEEENCFRKVGDHIIWHQHK